MSGQRVTAKSIMLLEWQCNQLAAKVKQVHGDRLLTCSAAWAGCAVGGMTHHGEWAICCERVKA